MDGGTVLRGPGLRGHPRGIERPFVLSAWRGGKPAGLAAGRNHDKSSTPLSRALTPAGVSDPKTLTAFGNRELDELRDAESGSAGGT